MKRLKSECVCAGRRTLSHILLFITAFYLLLLTSKFPQVLEILTTNGEGIYGSFDSSMIEDNEGLDFSKPTFGSAYKDALHRKFEANQKQDAPSKELLVEAIRVDALHRESETNQKQEAPSKELLENIIRVGSKEDLSVTRLQNGYGRLTGEIFRQRNRTSNMSSFEITAEEAWSLGAKAWKEVIKHGANDMEGDITIEGTAEACPSWISVSGEEFSAGGNVLFLPCGLAAGSSITLVGTPHMPHREFVPHGARFRREGGFVLVSQFTVELQGLKAVDGEAPPKILHLNPRLRGDWSKHPVIEHNTCYRMQWGSAHRCDGIPSSKQEDALVDGFLKCEKWIRDDIIDSKESKTTAWFGRFVGREQRPEVTWPFPFVEGKLFIMTVHAGVEGYHVIVGGRHVTSFPYRPGFALEDATGLAIQGGVDVHSVYATSLPSSHPSFSPYKVIEMSAKWKARPLPKHTLKLFIGILSASNHFAERMAIRKTWMQHSAVKSSDVVVRFFVALNPRKEVNSILKKEADYFSDVVILKFVDHYDLVVLKTIAICEFGVQNVSAAYIMKCDDDTFVRIDSVLKEINRVSVKQPLYMGNLNLLHRPLRTGKWAVTFEEWPEAVYPPYANGPGYIISTTIAEFIVTQRKAKTLRLFKMEDVSMGMWVQRFNATERVQYSHNWKFCQYGCLEDYYTAHYQSPRQMICLWEKLAAGRAHCCNFR